MNELKPAARAALRVMGDADGPSVEDRERLRRRVFGAIAASGALAAPSAAGASTIAGAGASTSTIAGAGASTIAGAKLAWFGPAAVWLAVGGLAGSVVAVSSELVIEKAEPARSVVAPAAPARSRVTSAPALPALPTAVPARSSVEVVLRDDTSPRAAPRVERDVRAERASAPESGAARRARAEMPAPVPGIREELALLEQAHRELSQGDPSASLATLDDHARRFPSGAFTAERTAARVFALCALGQIGRARAAADEFLRVEPSSPLVPRIRSSCVAREP